MKTSALEPLRYLTREEMDAIHGAALQIRERTGMWIDHVRALEFLRAAGCRVDMEQRTVKFQPEQVEAAVARMRRNFLDANRWPKRMSVRYSQVRFETEHCAFMRTSPYVVADSAASSGTWTANDDMPHCKTFANR